MKNCPRKFMVSLGLATIFHDQNYSHYKSGLQMQICNLNDFFIDSLNMDNGLPFTNEDYLLRSHFTTVNISDEPGLTIYQRPLIVFTGIGSIGPFRAFLDHK